MMLQAYLDHLHTYGPRSLGVIADRLEGIDPEKLDGDLASGLGVEAMMALGWVGLWRTDGGPAWLGDVNGHAVDGPNAVRSADYTFKRVLADKRVVRVSSHVYPTGQSLVAIRYGFSSSDAQASYPALSVALLAATCRMYAALNQEPGA